MRGPYWLADLAPYSLADLAPYSLADLVPYILEDPVPYILAIFVHIGFPFLAVQCRRVPVKGSRAVGF